MSPLRLRLTDLITQLEDELPEADPIARVTEAQLRAEGLSVLGDQLVNHFVYAAREAGASWSQVGQAIGVSKQAAQQRHAPVAHQSFSAFTRHSVVLAQEAARSRKHDVIGSEHLLLGLLGEPRGLAYALLVDRVGSERRIRDAIEELMPAAGRRTARGHLALRADAQEALERATRASADLGDGGRVDTEHLLLGLIGTARCPAARVLRALGFTQTGVREAIRVQAASSGPARNR